MTSLPDLPALCKSKKTQYSKQPRRRSKSSFVNNSSEPFIFKSAVIPDFSAMEGIKFAKRHIRRDSFVPTTPKKVRVSPNRQPFIKVEHFADRAAKPKVLPSKAELENYLSNFTDLQNIGVGSFGTVYKALHVQEQRYYALKVLKYPIASDTERTRLIKELCYVKSFYPHPHLVSYIFAWEQIENDCPLLHLQMELCRENLSKYISSFQQHNDSKYFEEDRLWRFLTDIALGLRRIHSQQLVHRDIKPSNIFFDYDDNLRIGDFGLLVRLSECESDSRDGDNRYMAPEVTRDDEVTLSADIFSLGMTIFEAACLIELPNSGSSWDLLRGSDPCSISEFPSFYSYELQQLLNKMLHPSPGERPSIEDIIAHPRVAFELEKRSAERSSQYVYELSRAPTPYSILSLDLHTSPVTNSKVSRKLF